MLSFESFTKSRQQSSEDNHKTIEERIDRCDDQMKKKHYKNDIEIKNEHQQLIYNDSQNANIEHLFSFENSIENKIVIVHRTRKYEKRMNNSAKESTL
jgi:uncharacterized membrane protein YhiD involved in acid resistance